MPYFKKPYLDFKNIKRILGDLVDSKKKKSTMELIFEKDLLIKAETFFLENPKETEFKITTELIIRIID